MGHDVFISHSSKDKQVANAVVHWLESAGIKCWIAPRDVPGGINYSASIVKAIKDSSVLVLILTESANSSIPVAGEVEQAVRQGVPIVPFRVEDIEPCPEIMLHIGSIHWLDAISPPLETHLDKLAQTVRVFLDVIEDTPTRTDQAIVGAPPSQPDHTRESTRNVFMKPIAWVSAITVLVVILVFVNPGANHAGANPPANETTEEGTQDGPQDQTNQADANKPSIGGDELPSTETIVPPLTQISVDTSADSRSHVVRGFVLNESEHQSLMSTLQLELGAQIIDEVRVDADRVRSLVHERLQQSGVEPARVLVRHRPNWGETYLDLRVPPGATERVKELVREYLLDPERAVITEQP